MNRDKKTRGRGAPGEGGQWGEGGGADYSEHALHWAQQQEGGGAPPQQQTQGQGGAGDSWV